jgi:phosphoribosyl-ATP pyrophosphohydrolase
MNTITKRFPPELIRYIKEYIPKKTFVFTNRENYNLYHTLIKSSIKDYESYIRSMIRQDNEFVFKKIIEENYNKWYEIRQYKYKNMIFNNYLYFVMNFCIENDSNNCRKIISDFLKEHGLGKNLHKKNVVKYIKWKNSI